MKEKNYERAMVVMTKGVKEWINDEYITHPRKSWDSVQKTAYEIWNWLELDGSGSYLNKKHNGEPIFYLNADDPNKLLEIGPNKTVGDVAVSLEGQIIAAINRGNIKYDKVPTKTSRHSHKASENVWYKVEFDSALNHIDYMWFTKYTDEGYPEKGKPFFKNAKGNLGNWPRGLTSLMKEDEQARKKEKAEKEKSKAEKDKLREEWVKGNGDGSGTREGFILCGKENMQPLVEEIKTQNPQRVASNDWGFIERAVKAHLKRPIRVSSEEVSGVKSEPVRELAHENILDLLKGMDNVEVLGIEVKKPVKKYRGIYYIKFKDGEGKHRSRSLRTKVKKEAISLHKRALKLVGKKVTAKPEQKPTETMKTTEQESSAWNWLGGLFGKNEQVKVIDEPNEELDETVWIEPNEPEPMKEVLYNVRDANGALMKANDRILEITETLELKAKAKAFDELELTLVPHHIAAVEARLAEIEQERKRLMEELGNDAK